jgi:L-asparaginase
MPLPKILLIFCGGTIVMTETEDGVHALQDKETSMKQLLELEPKIKDIADVNVHYLENIESCDMHPKYWDQMTNIITENYNEYDGFIITHGTDTMAYTASALTCSLQNLGKPVILTGAQIPGNQIETDARRNFVNAIRVASMDLSGVHLVFDERIIPGGRASKISESELDAYRTINGDDSGEIRIDIRTNRNNKKRNSSQALISTPGFESDILVINIAPGTDPNDIIKLINAGDIKGLIIRVYGVGNIAKEYLPVFSAAQNMKIPVVVMTQCMNGSTLMHNFFYGREMIKSGAIQAFNMSVEMTTVKLMWAVRHYSYEKIGEIMHTNFYGEIDTDGKIH